MPHPAPHRSAAVVATCALLAGSISPLVGQSPSTARINMSQLTLRAQAGDSKAMVELGYYYLEGASVTRDLDAATRWYRAATEAGHPVAMNNYGWMHEHGIGVVQNAAEAARWYQKAAEAGHVTAMTNLGQLHKFGLVGVESLEDSKWYARFETGRGPRSAAIVRNDGVAMSWLLKAAQAGNGAAMAQIAEMYRYGRTEDVPADRLREQTIAWVEKAAAAGDPQGLFMMRDFPAVQSAAPRRAHTAQEIEAMSRPEARRASAARESERQQALNAEREADRITWTRRAAEMGHPRAIVELASWLQNVGASGIDQTQYERLAPMFKKEIDKRRAATQKYAAEYPRVAGWLRQVADAGDADAMTQLGFWYLKGIGVDKNEREGVEWTLRGVEGGSAQAYIHLSEFYSTGSYGYPRDPGKAREVLRQLSTHPDQAMAAAGQRALGEYDDRRARSATMWDKLKPVLMLGAAFVIVAAFSDGEGTLTPGSGGVMPGPGASRAPRSPRCEVVSKSFGTVHGSKQIMGGPGTITRCY